MSHRSLTALVLAARLLLAAPSSYAQQTGAGEAERWRAMVERLEPAAFIRLRLKDGSTRKGTVLAAEGSRFSFKPRTRIPVPAVDISYDDVVSIERAKPGMNPGQKVLAGTAGIAAGALLLLALAIASLYD